MTDDFIQEMNEELRNQRLKAAAQKYGVVAVVLLILAVIGGGVWLWENHNLKVAQHRASERYFEALRFLDNHSESNNSDNVDLKKKAEAILTNLADNSPEGVKSYAQMRLADLKEQEGDQQAALELWNKVQKNKKADSALKNLASYLSLNSQFSKLTADDLRQGYQKLIQQGGSWASLGREGLVALDLQSGSTAEQHKEAKRLLVEIQSSPDSSDALRQRANLLIKTLGDVE
ncbi:hypothetical protein [Aristophania vespae]|uniref:hypothetical protein n=1 Tax=Aristophania vespae TaxID=2697033 RepID=UPI0023511528|nr:hypothetical protein [Aristophania vespae]UMM63327.1 hypothetical protein DM15PD_02850 [Aristophania vespae]